MILRAQLIIHNNYSNQSFNQPPRNQQRDSPSRVPKAHETPWKEWNESKKSIVKVKSLPPALFPNGDQYFNLYNDSQREEVILVHANWIVGGSNKKHSFIDHGLWKIPD